MKEQDQRANVGEIRKALGGGCDWVTRNVLKRAGNRLPTRGQIATWAENPPAWFLREKQKRVKREADKVVITCPGCDFTIRVRSEAARERKHWEGLYCGRSACGWKPQHAEGMLLTTCFNAVGSFSGWKHTFPTAEEAAAVQRARELAVLGAAQAAVHPAAPKKKAPSPVRFVQNTKDHMWITKPVLKARGWTDAGIRDFLPDPERHKKNPHYSSAGAPMPVWSPATVAKAEARPEWKAWLEKSLKRRRTTLAALSFPSDTEGRFAEKLDAAQAAIDAALQEG